VVCYYLNGFGGAIGLNVFAYGWQTGSGNFKKEDEELR
jgi:hypothetical protein